MTKTKVVHITEPFVSGIYTYVKHIVNFSSNNEIDSTVIYSGSRLEMEIENVKKEFNDKTTFIRVDMEREISPFQDIISLIKIIKTIRSIKPDAIHLHSSKAGVLGRIASVFYPKAKIFYTPNGYSFIREDISDLKKMLFKFIEKICTLLFGEVTIACGDQEYDEASKIGKAVLIRNGVFIDDILKLKTDNINQKLTIGTSGRISIQKNPKVFNEIALKLPNYQFVWIGEGELKNVLTSKNIVITGWKKGEEAIKAVSKLDVFISTSLWEGLPFNIIEAMALSKPIITSNIKANLPTVNDNKNGYICKNVDEYIEAIKTLENIDLRNKFGNESMSRCRQLFNLDKNFVELIKIYKS